MYCFASLVFVLAGIVEGVRFSKIIGLLVEGRKKSKDFERGEWRLSVHYGELLKSYRVLSQKLNKETSVSNMEINGH